VVRHDSQKFAGRFALLAAAAVGWLLLLGTGHRLWPLYRPPLKEQPTSGEEEIVWGPDEP